jgi:hypothetical protein
LQARFNLEIQSEHSGKGRSLSLEGASVESYLQNDVKKYKRGLAMLNEINVTMESHSHFSDISRKDASTTLQHTEELVKTLKERGLLIRGMTLVVDTDGCCKQYRCGNSICFKFPSIIRAQYNN